ncbi:hypothetical protein CV102_19005 [Natronococcus pandeyae]|uniref:Uncharacterized protein n=1 Tax=Natronococcus pandeyae TaxID=2055836 RepID=A0A8J8PYC1_9EURY|nr:hypothetical protein CV102_19005 [Natronococcus pandeyae]
MADLGLEEETLAGGQGKVEAVAERVVDELGYRPGYKGGSGCRFDRSRSPRPPVNDCGQDATPGWFVVPTDCARTDDAL